MGKSDAAWVYILGEVNISSSTTTMRGPGRYWCTEPELLTTAEGHTLCEVNWDEPGPASETEAAQPAVMTGLSGVLSREDLRGEPEEPVAVAAKQPTVTEVTKAADTAVDMVDETTSMVAGIAKEVADEAESFACDVCDRSFTSEGRLGVHLDSKAHAEAVAKAEVDGE